MSADKHLELRDGYVYFYPPQGLPVSLVLQALQEITSLCTERQQFKLLIDATDFAKQPPSLIELFSLVVDASKTWDRRIKTAVVDPARWLKMDSFVENVARNRGIHFVDFPTEEEALAWLANA